MRERQESFNSGTLLQVMAKELCITDDDACAIIESAVDKLPNGVATSSTVAGWARVIREEAGKRSVSSAGAILDDVARNDGMTMPEKLEEAQRILDEAKSRAAGKKKRISGAEMIRHTLANHDKVAATGELPGMSTGSSDLDAVLPGFSPAELIILAARPAMGKTALALNFAYAAAVGQRKPVLFISLEMKTAQIGPRWISLLTGTPMSPIKKGKLTPEQRQKLEKLPDELLNAPLELTETHSMTMADIANVARMAHAETPGGLGMLIVDYLQLITASGRSNSTRTEIVSEISRQLKQLSGELDIPVIALSQLNRTLEQRQDKRPLMSDLRESGAIEQDADVILLLYRDEVYNPFSADKGKAEIIIAKQRNGSTGIVMQQFDGACQKFADIDHRTPVGGKVRTFLEQMDEVKAKHYAS